MAKQPRRVLRLPRKTKVSDVASTVDARASGFAVCHTIWFDQHTMLRVNCPPGTSAQELLKLIKRGIWAEEAEAHLQKNLGDMEVEGLLQAYPRHL